ncbi:MAG: toll/interleukin-1 receptor domain-containing protein [Phycisphaerales bacterium]|nr:MAG: toll/interleukin-1 receptor domain-containing protein [Phycisphaerales bacterium]
MKVFISWSGERSQALAQGLRNWLPLVLHYVEPWLSEADVAAGERWAQEVAKELDASNFGIICVTPENVGAPWVLFEAGALGKSMQGSRVIPLLFSLEFSDITGPLAQFQAKKVERSGLGEVVLSVNQAADEGIPEDRANQLFEALWPEFEKHLTDIPEKAPTEKHGRPQHEILEELVTGVRGLDSRFRELEEVVSAHPGRSPFSRRTARFHPMMLRELSHMMGSAPDDPIGLVISGSMFREALPWVYELAIEAYRATKSSPSGEGRSAVKKFQRAMEATLHMPFPLEELGLDPETVHMFSRDLRRFTESAPSVEEEVSPRQRPPRDSER